MGSKAGVPKSLRKQIVIDGKKLPVLKWSVKAGMWYAETPEGVYMLAEALEGAKRRKIDG